MSASAAAPQQGQYGTIGARIGAYFLDGLFGGLATLGGIVLAVIAGFVIGLASVEAGVIVFYLGYILAGLGYSIFVWRMLATKGYSPGKKLLGLRLVDAETLQPIGWWRVWLRGFVLSLITIFTCGIGAIVVAVLANNHPRRQGWHDLAVGTVVVPEAAAGLVGLSQAPSAAAVSPPVPSSASAPPPPSPPPPPLTASAPPPPPVRSAPPVSSPSMPVAVTPALTEPSGIVPPPPLASPPPPPQPEPASDAEVGEVVEEHTRAARSRAAPRWTLSDAAGPLDLSGLILAGRDPDASLVDGSTVWRLDDPERTVSKTHALFGLEEGRPYVEDWASTNGVLLRRDGTETNLVTHERVQLQSGDELQLGEYVVRLEDGA